MTKASFIRKMYIFEHGVEKVRERKPKEGFYLIIDDLAWFYVIREIFHWKR